MMVASEHLLVLFILAIFQSLDISLLPGVDGKQSGTYECSQSESSHGENTKTDDDIMTCDVGAGNEATKWKWNLDDNHHRCNIRRIRRNELAMVFKSGKIPPLHYEPIVIYNDEEHDEDGESLDNSKKDRYDGNKLNKYKPEECNDRYFFESTKLYQIKKSLPPNMTVILTSSNSHSSHRRIIPLETYLHETISNEVFPWDKSNETWYLFGETYSKDWQKLLETYCLPPCETCSKDLSALSFGIGGKGSGVQWHFHGPGFSQTIHGSRHWILYPPEQKPTYNSNYTSRFWMEEIYTSLPSDALPLECTLGPGDMIYFPDNWHHATLNMENYNVFVSTFTTEHGF